MQTLYYNNRLFVKTELVAKPLTATLLEVEGGKLHLLTAEQRLEMLTEQLGVNGINMLKVNLAVGAGLDLVTVNVVVVKAH